MTKKYGSVGAEVYGNVAKLGDDGFRVTCVTLPTSMYEQLNPADLQLFKTLGIPIVKTGEGMEPTYLKEKSPARRGWKDRERKPPKAAKGH